MKYIVDGDIVLSQPPDGPLTALIEAFAEWGREQGYAWCSRYRKVLLAAGFSRWLGKQTIRLRGISSEHTFRYLRSRARRVSRRRGDAAALRQFLDLLRCRHIIQAEKRTPCRVTASERTAHAFEQYLLNERALVRATVIHYVPFIRWFLTDRFGHGPVRLSRLRARDVTRFIQRQAPRLHLKRAKLMTTALRSFLHYARYRGDITLIWSPPSPRWPTGRCRRSRARFRQSPSASCWRPSIAGPREDDVTMRSSFYSPVWVCARAKWRFWSWTIWTGKPDRSPSEGNAAREPRSRYRLMSARRLPRI